MRDFLFERFYKITKIPYQRYFKKNKPWDITKEELLTYPEDSLGFHLGTFLQENQFEMEPKFEDHDVIHVLTGTGTTVSDEIAMQFYLLGNGKRSAYLLMVISSGVLCYPHRLKTYRHYYKRGKEALSFHYLDYSKLLLFPVSTIRNIFKIH